MNFLFALIRKISKRNSFYLKCINFFAVLMEFLYNSVLFVEFRFVDKRREEETQACNVEERKILINSSRAESSRQFWQKLRATKFQQKTDVITTNQINFILLRFNLKTENCFATLFIKLFPSNPTSIWLIQSQSRGKKSLEGVRVNFLNLKTLLIKNRFSQRNGGEKKKKTLSMELKSLSGEKRVFQFS